VVSDGLAVEAVGAANNSPYTLRGTLGLETVSSVTATKTITASVNAAVSSQSPYSTIGSSSRVTVVDGGLLGAKAGMMIRFDNLFGDAADQIPYGSQITSVSLTFVTKGDGLPNASASVYRMLADWNANSSWASMATSGLGLQRDNVEVVSSADATFSGLNKDTAVFTGAGMVDAVQGWANGGANRGWLLWQTSNNSLTVNTSSSWEDAHPSLKITYKPRVNTTSATGAGVTVAVIDSGIASESFEAGRVKTVRAISPPAWPIRRRQRLGTLTATARTWRVSWAATSPISAAWRRRSSS
jgi:hypothetical protein